MIDLYTWPTPNGHKVHIMLEELGLPYRVIPVNIGKGEQFAEHFLKITPNHRIPAMVDGETMIFESAAIMMYLAEKTGSSLLPASGAARYACLQWLLFENDAFVFACQNTNQIDRPLFIFISEIIFES